MTRAVEKLSIDWPAERADVRSRGKLDECFSPSRVQPQHRRLQFSDRGVEIMGETGFL